MFNAVTGPSGAGKSAFCKQQPDWEHRLYNLDDWARKQGEVDNPAVREDAWETLLERLVSDMREGISPITLDHVFESRTIDEVVRPAKSLGYLIRLWVICRKARKSAYGACKDAKARVGMDVQPEQFGNSTTAPSMSHRN